MIMNLLETLLITRILNSNNTFSCMVMSRIAKLAGNKLRSLAEKSDDVEYIVKLAFNFRYRVLYYPLITIKPSQIFEEILELARIVKTINITLGLTRTF